jgi:hypothetical protein
VMQRSRLEVNQPGDRYEQEADRLSGAVMRMADPGPVLQRVAQNTPAPSKAPPIVDDTLRSSGQPLDRQTRGFMEARFRQDFGQVRIHTDALAAESAQSVQAKAYTVGSQIVFGAGQYQPTSDAGRRLLAHELVHTIQQGATAVSRVQRYTEAERREMAEGRITARQSDIALANQRGFQPGDLVFRMGSTALGFLSGQPVTHGGIYIGNGLIHDVVGFGNRHVRVGDFYNPALGEAADRNVYRVVRFRGPLRNLIVARLLANIRSRNFDMPTDPIPFNLFSTADDYRTATCLEYAHAQFLHAIRELASDTTVSEPNRALLRSTYFAAGAALPRALIQPQTQRLMGDMPDPSAGSLSSPGLGMPPPRTASALTQQAALVIAANALASDVDPTRFSNRAETDYNVVWPGGSGIGGTLLNLIMGHSYDEVVLRTFTYQSFVDSRQFFEDVTRP